MIDIKFSPGPYAAEYINPPNQYGIKAADGDYIAVRCCRNDAWLFAASWELLNALILTSLEYPRNEKMHRESIEFAESLGWNPEEQSFGSFVAEYRHAAITKATKG